MSNALSDLFAGTIETLKAIAEPTRLRLVALLGRGDLSVKDLTSILGQSQPRLSRHLKILSDAGWIVRYPEGAWVYYRLTDDPQVRILWAAIGGVLREQSAVLEDDQARLQRLKDEQKERAQAFFQSHAARWDALRADLVPEEQVEEAIRAGLGRQRVSRFLDVGTGTGRLLVLLQDLYAKAVGIDPSPAMLKMARASLAEHRIDHAQVRQGDGLALSMPKDSQDLVALHQVMHFFDDPRPLLAEVRRVLAPSGRLLIVDFAPHALERLRTDHQHRRLGFDVSEVTRWLEALDLELVSAERLDPARAQAKTGAADTRLPVHVWIARDRRVLADLPPISSQFEVA